MRILAFLIVASSTASAAPIKPAEVARHFVAGKKLNVELSSPEVTPVGIGWAARFRQTHHGLPVIGADQVVRIDDHGKILRSAGAVFALEGLDLTPRLDENRAIELALHHGPAVRAGAHATLAIDPVAAGGPRLVWAVRPQPIPQLLENAVYLVDAHSGEFLKRIDLLKYGKASVFLANPVNTPQPAARDFPAGFDPTNPDGYLEGALLKSYDCIDSGEIKNVDTGGLGSLMIHICTVTPEAKSANYDYTGYSPATEPFAAPFNGCPNAPLKPAATDADSGAAELQPLDEFSEQHMYWHVADGYAFFRGLFTDNGRADFKLRAQPLAIAVNLCTVDFSAGITGNLAGPLIPFDNAFFSPGANNIVAETLIMGQDSIMFGQGTKYDFAYDGDVIKHEFTHAVIDTLGKLTLQGAEDVWGLQDDQGAMNEGLADYFSSVQAGNPTLGEYAGRDIPGGSGNEGAIRDLTNTDECGRDRWGEVHQDSQAFSASLWGGRVAIAGDPSSAGFDAAKGRLFDRAVLAAVAAFGGNVDMTTAATNVAAEVSMLLDGPSAQKLQDSFTTHKILPQCDRVIDYAGAGKKALLGLDGTDSPYAPSGAKRVPGFVQWQLDVPAGADSITAGTRLAAQAGSFSGSGSLLGGGAAPKLELIVGPAGMPIQWVVNTDAGNEAASAPFSGTTGTITATLGALVPGTYYVMIVNSGGGIIAQDVTLTTSCTNAAGCAPPDMAMPKTNSSGGCKCDVGGSGRAPLAPIVLMALVLAFRWRSSRRRWR